MTVYDCTMLLNEVDLYEVRLATLDEAVDVFVVAESSRTFAGSAKPFLLSDSVEAEPERWASWRSKLRIVQIDEEPYGWSPHQQTGDPMRWARENFQRSKIAQAMQDIAPEDVVLLSDLDEIVRPGVVSWYVREGLEHMFRPALPMHVYTPRWRWMDEPMGVIARLFRGRALHPPGDTWDGHLRGMSLEDVRQYPAPPTFPGFQADAYGWHLSYLGGVDRVRYKLLEAAHPEMVQPAMLADEWIARSIRTGRDVFGRNRPVVSVHDDELPPYLIDNHARFAHLFDPLNEGAS